MALDVLFLCTANSARSILAEATLRHLGGDRFGVYSAGSQPAGRVNPGALAQLERSGMSTRGLRSKAWDEFEGPDAPVFDVVITVCDSAAQEPCPVFFGDFVRVHWGLPDPAGVRASDASVASAFAKTHEVLRRRLQALVALPVESLSHDKLASALQDIAERVPAETLA